MSLGAEVMEHPAFDPALTAKGAAMYLGVHYKTLLELTRRRQIGVVKRQGGRRLTYRLSDLNAYLDSQRHAPRDREDESGDIDWSSI